MAARTFSAVAGRTLGLPCRTSDTVDLDTSAVRATSIIVALRLCFAIRLDGSVAIGLIGTFQSQLHNGSPQFSILVLKYRGLFDDFRTFQ